MPPPPPEPTRRAPDQRTLKGMVLWCARWLVGGGEFYRGKLEVEVRAGREGVKLTVEPRRGTDGLADPGALVPAAGTQATASELLGVLLSRDEERILAEMLGEKPVRANAVLDGCKVEKSKFYVLWSNLQQRLIVVDAEAEEGEGFKIGPAWVKDMVRAKVDGKTAAQGRCSSDQ